MTPIPLRNLPLEGEEDRAAATTLIRDSAGRTVTHLDLNLQAAAAEIFILAAVSVILMIDLFLDDARRHWSYLLTLVHWR